MLTPKSEPAATTAYSRASSQKYFSDSTTFGADCTSSKTINDFVGGDYYIMIGYYVSEHGSKYLIKSLKGTVIMDQESVYSMSYGSQTLPHADEYIPLGDMIRLLYGEPSKFGMRLEQYRIENMLETL